jgi:choline kinase
MTTQIAILAAGMGSRLGMSLPKPLTTLSDGRSIMGQQIENIEAVFDHNYRLTIVVGYKLEAIIERFPAATFVYNELFDQTNTSKSLLKALQSSFDGGVLWFNGDVVFDPSILAKCAPLIESDQSFVVVNTARTAEEEVKYTLDSAGNIKDLSKVVANGLGEAVGINFVAGKDKALLIKRLIEVDANDYFERGIELAIQHDKLEFKAVDISGMFAVEIDTPTDLESVNTDLKK